METNIIKLTKHYSMCSHTAEKVNRLFSSHLPYGYANDAKEKLIKEGRDVSETFIRQVKTFKRFDQQILNILIELANSNEAVAEARKAKFHKLISNT